MKSLHLSNKSCHHLDLSFHIIAEARIMFVFYCKIHVSLHVFEWLCEEEVGYRRA